MFDRRPPATQPSKRPRLEPSPKPLPERTLPERTLPERALERGVAKPSAPPSSSSRSPPALRCDRCDGPHVSTACPHFKKGRGNHPDAQLGSSLKGLGARSGPILLLRHGTVRPQPPDGSCLFHSLRFGLERCRPLHQNVPANARSLRAHLARWIASHADMRLADTPLSSWVKWDSGLSTNQYASKMERSGWGGGIEIAACSYSFAVNVWVYEKRRANRGGGFERISTFDAPSRGHAGTSGVADRTVHVLYQGGCHYDALIPDEREVAHYLATANQRAPPKPAPSTVGGSQRPLAPPQRPHLPMSHMRGGSRGHGGYGGHGGHGQRYHGRGGGGKGSPWHVGKGGRRHSF